jgi:hypothetical protein
VHRRLGPTCRDQVRPVVDPDTGDVTDRRTIEAVDAVLAARARDFTVTELARIGDRLVETLNPPGPDGTHERRYLTLSQLADGSLQGRFSCGPAQALKLLAVVAALAAPRPGKAIDADGVERDLPDQRSAPQRRIDALIEAIDHHPCTAHLFRQFIAQTISNHSTDGGDSDGSDENAAETNDTADADLAHHATDNHGDLAHGADRMGEDLAQSEEPPPEGEWQIRRPPGVRTGPYPDIEIIVTATLDQLAHARALAAHSPANQVALDPVAGTGHDGFARAQHGGGVHPTTLALLACNAQIRRVVLDDHGAVLHLGRAHRLATPAQKAALFARDVGCVMPGCTIPGDLCEIHHVTPWSDDGRTDIDNLVLVCPRHHVEVTDGTWDLVMINGVPWARPPAWAHPTRPLLRNASHHGTAAA